MEIQGSENQTTTNKIPQTITHLISPSERNKNDWSLHPHSFQSPKHHKFPFLRLPIYQEETDIIACHIENEPDSHWMFKIYDRSLRTKYLGNNEFIYFTHSENNYVMSVDAEKKVVETSLVKVTHDHEK